MIYFALYIFAIATIWWMYSLGFKESLKQLISVLVPTVLIIIFNLKAGKFIFKNPLLGFISILPTALFIYQVTKPLIVSVNNSIENSFRNNEDDEHVVEVDVISKEDA